MAENTVSTVAEPCSGYVADVASYRQAFRRYLADLDWAQEWRAATSTSAEDQMAHDAGVLARLYQAGWNRYGWPHAAGGLGGNEIHRATYYEELGRAGLPVPAQHWTLETLGPALLAFAPAVAQAHLPAYLAGTEWWGQCFSEPEAGSDLAALRTRAADNGSDGFTVNGQKIWTSQGPTATRLLVLVRTGPADSRHRGLTMMMVDADTTGVTIRPIALASGRRELAEVFFDDVRVPRDRLVGEVGDGWAVAMYLMQFERGMYGYALLTTMLAELATLRSQISVQGTSGTNRDRFARTYIEVVAAQARAAQTVRQLAGGQTIGPGSSVDKLLFSSAEKRVQDLVFDVRQAWMINGEEPAHRGLDAARAQWWYSRAATIMGGSAEVQRGLIADHILRLPKQIRR
ncbi:Putative acyl-CoA dehydrogenase FadE17 [Mycolicibacterium vanbaalenii]|uniref:Acyl-CoA dehydrogenase FadE17 n=1 Tax=Mycolicibacterium vanbaalenii TaxID=110539 RepID=A0A5S9NKL1_MYCVN|nr:acyl-CoA dehydrogenase family protein [Mycolicibacterium vanbaalenii]CAA0089461.1 Putative acyl-CoA dehydrogenase FadE17 [Mycolicibacterium vanbaalenii]